MKPLRLAVCALFLSAVVPVVAFAQFTTPTLVAQWGGQGSGPGQLLHPYGIAVSAAGEVFVSDYYNDRIQVFDRRGGFLREMDLDFASTLEFAKPTGVAVSSAGEVFVSDEGNGHIDVLSMAGTFLRRIGNSGSGSGQLYHPCGVAVDTDGSVYVMDVGNTRIEVFTSAGTFKRRWPPSDAENDFVALDHQGHVWRADKGNNRVRLWTTAGGLQSAFGTTGPGLGSMNGATGITLDSHGLVYVTDYDDDRVLVFATQSPVPTRTSTWGALKATYR